MSTYDRLHHAILNGINLERLLIATGLDQYTFYQYMDNQLFTNHQETAIRDEIREWSSLV